jgi:hypothetical protein
MGGMLTTVMRRGKALKAEHGLGLLLLLQLWLIVAHVPWRDELQAYLLVRESHGLGGLFADLHYEGHPSLWYLVLGPLQAVIQSPVALKAAQVLVALSVAALVWLRAPFPPWVKLLILAGYFPLFEYGVIARSYGLGEALVFAWLAFRRTWWGWLILALMANVAVNFAFLSGILVLAGLWIERRWSWSGLALWAIAGLAAVATIIPAHDVSTGALDLPLWVRWIEALRRESAILVPSLVGVWPYRWQVLVSPLESPLPAAIVGVIAGGVAAWSVARDRRASALVIMLFVAMTAMSALIYTTYPRHVGVLVLLAIALEWIRVETGGETVSRAFLGWMGVSALCGLWAAVWALFVPFSYGRQEIDWIKAHHLETARWAVYPGYVGADISAHLGPPTDNLQKGGCLDTFIRWDTHAYDDVEDDDLADAINQPGPFAYLASDRDLSGLHAPLKLMAHFNRGLGDNGVFLYAVQHPVQGTAPACR